MKGDILCQFYFLLCELLFASGQPSLFSGKVFGVDKIEYTTLVADDRRSPQRPLLVVNEEVGFWPSANLIIEYFVLRQYELLIDDLLELRILVQHVLALVPLDVTQDFELFVMGIAHRQVDVNDFQPL